MSFTLPVPSETVVKRDYSGFTGVTCAESSEDGSQKRFPFCVNMFKDYSSDTGCVKTRPGYFRAATNFPGVSAGNYGFCLFDYNGAVYVRESTYFIKWNCFPKNPAEVVLGQTSVETCAAYTVISASLPSTDTPYYTDYEPCSVVVDNILYVYENCGILVYDGQTLSYYSDQSSIIDTSQPIDTEDIDTWRAPVAYINCGSDGSGEVFQPLNIFSPFYRVKFVCDGTSTVYTVPGTVGSVLAQNGGTATLQQNKITFTAAPEANKSFTALARLDMTEALHMQGWQDVLGRMTLAAIFDNRVFLAGNTLRSYTSRIIHTAVSSPLYFPDNAYYNDDEGGKITGLHAIGSNLVVLKEDIYGKSTVYLHTQKETGIDLAPRAYPSVTGLYDAGCVNRASSAVINDRVVFLSRNGVNALTKTDLTQERSVVHLSSQVDALLTKCDLLHASLTSWQGYIVIHADDKVFLGDTNSTYYNKNTACYEYEWFIWQDVTFDDTIAASESSYYRIKTVRIGKRGTEYLITYNKNRNVCFFNKDAAADQARNIFSCCATPVDNFGFAGRLKRTNMLSGVARIVGEGVKTAVKRDGSDFGKVVRDKKSNTFSFSDTTQVPVLFTKQSGLNYSYKIRERNWRSISLIFYSEAPFSFYGASLEATVGRYI